MKLHKLHTYSVISCTHPTLSEYKLIMWKSRGNSHEQLDEPVSALYKCFNEGLAVLPVTMGLLCASPPGRTNSCFVNEHHTMNLTRKKRFIV